ncbi:chorismate-binding protein [Aquirufa sp.]|jgi:isochorismate synthase|uniref:chorismate-binding protein n=1 Tax=Aquirufa sp. TaxID=2676249 RepID=UPI0037C0AE38
MFDEKKEWKQIWDKAPQVGAALAMWKLPYQRQQFLLQDLSGGVQVEVSELEQLGPGFLISPFIGLPYFLSASHLSQSLVNDNPSEPIPTIKPVEVFEDKLLFQDQVASSVEQIKQGQFQKVVLSRVDVKDLAANFDLVDAFDRLCQTYPSAFVSAIYLPALQDVWLCATPETLVSQNSAGIFKTISLAGTQSALDADGNFLSPSEARWSQKEIEEQAYVSRYIIDCFKKIRLREYIENGPKTVLAGNLMHLKTEYLVDTRKYSYPGLITQMLSLLHPTSAVCGTPKEAALEWILQTERHDRVLYSGYLGPINQHDETHLFVNLRTVQMKGEQAYYYAGCGITEDSDPEKEWQETGMKCQTLQRVINASF